MSNYNNKLSLLQRVKNDAIRVQEQTWQIEQSLSANPLLRFFHRKILQLVISPQREYNAATLRSMYAISEQIDYIAKMLDALDQKLRKAEQRISDLEAGVSNLETGIANLEIRTSNLETGIANLEIRTSNLEIGVQDHNHRQVKEVHQIGQQIRDFADQIVGIEETISQILSHIGNIPASPPKHKD